MKIKCLNCIHYSTCALRMSGLDIKTLNEKCDDYLGIKDVWISPVKFGDTVYIIEDGSIYSACVGCIEGFLTSNGVKWTIHYSYSNDTWGEPEVYSWSGAYGHRVFKTEKDAVNYLEKNKKGSNDNEELF